MKSEHHHTADRAAVWGWTGLQQYQPTELATVASRAESPARG